MKALSTYRWIYQYHHCIIGKSKSNLIEIRDEVWILVYVIFAHNYARKYINMSSLIKMNRNRKFDVILNLIPTYEQTYLYWCHSNSSSKSQIPNNMCQNLKSQNDFGIWAACIHHTVWKVNGILDLKIWKELVMRWGLNHNEIAYINYEKRSKLTISILPSPGCTTRDREENPRHGVRVNRQNIGGS